MESRVEKAGRLFKEGYNCAQAVVAAFCDLYDIDVDMALRMSCAFGAGIGRRREVCGAVSGMAIIAGLENGITDGKDIQGKKDNYDLVNRMVNEFEKEYGSIICADLLGVEKTIGKKINTKPDVRNDEYYKKRPCMQQVMDCARIVEEMIIKESNKINRKVDFVQVSNPDQVTKVIDLADEIWREYYNGILSDEQIEYMVDRYQSDNVVTKRMINEGYEFYLINNGEKVIGFISILDNEDSLLLNNVYLLEENRKKGYVELVISKLSKKYKNSHINKMIITLNKLNEEGIKIYTDLGFSKFTEDVQDIGNGYKLNNCLLEKNI